MSDLKRHNEDAIKEMKISWSEMLKRLDEHSEAHKCMVTELLDVSKRRAEIEAEYQKSLTKLCDRSAEKRERMMSQYKKHVNHGDACGMLNLLRLLETEMRSRIVMSSDAAEVYSDRLQQAANSYIELHGIKYLKSKDLIISMSDKMNCYLDESNVAKEEYMSHFVKEYKMQKQLAKRHQSKSAKFDEKSRIHAEMVAKTDRSKNSYVLAVSSLKSCFEACLSDRLAEVFLVMMYKYGEFGTYCTDEIKKLATASKNYSELIETASQSLVFSEAAECEVALRTHMDQLFVNGLPIVPIFHCSETHPFMTFSGNVRKECVNQNDELKRKISDIELALTKVVQQIEGEREKPYIWSMSDKDRGKPKKRPLKTDGRVEGGQHLDHFGKYVTLVKQYVMDSLNLAHVKEYQNVLDSELQDVSITERSRIKQDDQDMRMVMSFGIDLTKHCVDNEVQIPVPLSFLVNNLHAINGFASEGVFRLSGVRSTIANAKQSLISTGKLPPGTDVNTIANLIKQYVRELKGFVDDGVTLNKIMKINDFTSSAFFLTAKTLLDGMPEYSRAVFIFLMKLINFAATFKRQNKMDCKNLAVVFGATIFSKLDDQSALNQQASINEFVGLISENIFKICPNELPLFYKAERFATIRRTNAPVQSREDSDLASHISIDEECELELTGPTAKNEKLAESPPHSAFDQPINEEPEVGGKTN